MAPNGIKISHRMNPRPSAEELRYFQLMGIDCATIWTTLEDANEDYIRETRLLLEAHGISLWNVGIVDLHCDPTMVLDLPGRDQKIAQYKAYLRALGAAGVYNTTYAHMANIKMLPYYQTGTSQTRGVVTREFDMEKAKDLPLSHDREYSDDEVWATFEDFVQEAVPVAEEAGVHIALHPDDPPVPVLGGVARIFRHVSAYERALELANSPNFGLCLCVGTWAEGGAEMGKNVSEMIRDFGAQKRIFKVHFRNVDAPLPLFREVFVDNGYIDMYDVLKGLREVDFQGVLLPDHIPGDGPDKACASYTLGYMRAMRDRVNAEAEAR